MGEQQHNFWNHPISARPHDKYEVHCCLSNNISGPLPSQVGLLTKLTLLRLFSNNLTGKLPSEVFRLRNLIALEFQNNSLTGSLGNEIQVMSSLLALDLSSNNSSLTIPTELGKLSQLSLLNLSFNSMTGLTPSELGNLNASTSRISLLGNYWLGATPLELCPWHCADRLQVDCFMATCEQPCQCQ